MPSPHQRLNRQALMGLIVGMVGLAACVPTTKTKAEPTPDLAQDLAPDLAPDSASVNYETQRDRPTGLLIGSRADRVPPLQDCGTLTTQLAMNECAQKNYARVEDERDFIYQAWQKVLSEDGQTTLAAAENAWTQFRDLTCGFERDQFAGGSIAPFIYSGCLTGETIARTDELYKPELTQTAYESADGILNADYQALQAMLSDTRRSELIAAQLAWIEYRDRHCDFEANYGAANIKTDQCKARLSEKRARQIQADIEQNNM